MQVRNVPYRTTRQRVQVRPIAQAAERAAQAKAIADREAAELVAKELQAKKRAEIAEVLKEQCRGLARRAVRDPHPEGIWIGDARFLDNGSIEIDGSVEARNAFNALRTNTFTCVVENGMIRLIP